MPRFAANMSFNPIEPLKPTTSQNPTVNLSDTKPSILQPAKTSTEIVPDVEFDWNSSGLQNPLDGKLFRFLIKFLDYGFTYRFLSFFSSLYCS
jgi:hypothetical protein